MRLITGFTRLCVCVFAMRLFGEILNLKSTTPESPKLHPLEHDP